MDQEDVILQPANRDNLLARWKPTIDETFDIFTWTSGHELAWLAEQASRASMIVEVGSYHGKSAKVMSLASPSAHIFCIDKPQDDRCRRILLANVHDEIIGEKIHVYIGTTDTMEWDLAAVLFQFAFIDGGHLEEDVRKDIANLLPCMAPGAILAGHDWRRDNPDDGVNRAVLQAFGKDRVNIYESIWWVKL